MNEIEILKTLLTSPSSSAENVCGGVVKNVSVNSLCTSSVGLFSSSVWFHVASVMPTELFPKHAAFLSVTGPKYYLRI